MLHFATIYDFGTEKWYSLHIRLSDFSEELLFSVTRREFAKITIAVDNNWVKNKKQNNSMRGLTTHRVLREVIE